MEKQLVKKILCAVISFAIIVAIAAVVIVAYNYYFEWQAQKFADKIVVVLEEADRENALMELSRLRGRIWEIELLSYDSDIPNGKLSEALDDIIKSQDYKNPYLRDFKLVSHVHAYSDVGELCEELLSQIDDQIHTIRFGEEDA